MFQVWLSAAALLIGAEAAASAQQAPPPPVGPAQGITVTGKVKKVCQRTTRIDSIIPVRVCKTVDEWAAEEAAAQATFAGMKDDQYLRENARRLYNQKTGNE